MKQVFRSVFVGWAESLAMVSLTAVLVMGSVAGAQQDEHGRKYKPLPPLSHIVVKVVKGFDGKPMPSVAVIFHSTMEGRDNGNLEVKTDPEGKATIDAIEVGSDVDVQVIANGFSTYAGELGSVGANAGMTVRMLRPREQVSVYRDAEGKPAQEKPGIQEPPHPVVAPPKPNQDGYAMPATPPATPQSNPQ
jgi:hypothetical protein